jgi:ABC-type sugar transport system permease subunit
MIIFLPVINILALMIALLLNRPFKLRGFFRAIFFLPVIITSGPVIAELLRQGAGSLPVLNESNFVAQLLEAIPPFMRDPLDTLLSQIIFMLWFSGVQVVIYLAGLQKLDTSMYEAAQIDGANVWEMFWKITIPSLKPMMIISSVYTLVTLATFSTNPVISLIATSMFDPIRGYGYASALAWIYFVVIVMILSITIRLLSPKEKSYQVVKEIERLKR